MGKISCSLGEVAGVGRVAPQKLTIAAAPVEPVLPYNEADGSGEQDYKILFPVFGGAMTRQKSRRSRV